ncbi:MAG: hypothetical protein CMN60_05945 [Sphingobium sp.]|mgnify:CR=1 FL=1|nr:hypothetical protein [Erythrobacter sp.]MBS47258.1 hypothetical protein [Sphingobium sp.]|tara:strand:+ start:2367 stop:2801 length:435 start_codon:yes stop_codon:yes gene_type:complete
MDELRDFLDDIYDPGVVMARIGHLPRNAQREIEQITRIVRAAFGYGEAEMPEQGQILRIALTGPSAERCGAGDEIGGYDFHIAVNIPECTDEVHWRFARRLIASEIGGQRAVTLAVTAKDCPAGIVLYDVGKDLPLNTRELSFR